MHDIDDYPDAKPVPGWWSTATTRRCSSPTPRTSSARARRGRGLRRAPVEWFLLNAEANVEVDITAVDALDELRAELDRRGIVFAMARVKQDLRDDLQAAGLIDRVGEDRIFMTLPTAVQAYLRWYVEHHGDLPPGFVPQPPLEPLGREPERPGGPVRPAPPREPDP